MKMKFIIATVQAVLVWGKVFFLSLTVVTVVWLYGIRLKLQIAVTKLISIFQNMRSITNRMQ